MPLKQQIDADIKQAMLAKKQTELLALRSIKSKILLEETKEGRAIQGDLTEAEELQLLNKEAKQRREAAEIYTKQGRVDLAQKELEELAVIERYLPKPLSPEELKAELQAIIAQVGATKPQDMGKVMGVATKKLAGRADGKAISEMVKTLLNS
ncbi:MAG: GatB/YqeY domain-containing protein [Microscillaceae bacterium]|nr:GatB/YqeY domain-containing protein [Microscillaceae bacterium]MDW8460037.1 GatB/YqeY domain-containing protein [Cytophagales bacterium]